MPLVNRECGRCLLVAPEGAPCPLDVPGCRRAPAHGQNLGQRLQEPVHQPSALERAARVLPGGGVTVRRDGFLISRRGRQRHRARGLGRDRRGEPGRNDMRCAARGGLLGRGIIVVRHDAIPPDPRIALAGFHKVRAGGKAVDDEIVPATLRPLFGALIAADDQPLGGARHRHIEQPAVLVLRLLPRQRARRSDRGDVVVLAAGPDDAGRSTRRRPCLRHGQEWRRSGRSGRGRRGVCEDHHRRLQTLGAMHRHHPDFVALDLHVALDHGLGGPQPREKAL